MLKRVLPLVIVLPVSILGAQEEVTGPFGLTFGAARAEIEAIAGPLTESSTHTFVPAKVPRPHPSFSEFRLVISPTLGLCTIQALSPAINANDFGSELKTAFNAIQEQLISRYGPATRAVDALQPGSIWNEPNDWMMALARRERSLMTSWSNPAPGMTQVAIAASALSRRDARVILFYFSDRSDRCDDEISQAQQSVL